MKWLRTIIVFDQGDVASSPHWRSIHNYLRTKFLDCMVKTEGWHPEGDVNLGTKRKPPELRLYPGGKVYQEPITSEFGGFDFVTTTPIRNARRAFNRSHWQHRGIVWLSFHVDGHGEKREMRAASGKRCGT